MRKRLFESIDDKNSIILYLNDETTQSLALWKRKALDIIRINESDVERIPFLQYEGAIKVIDHLKKDPEIKEIIIYGSLGRKKMTRYSDIDIFVTTEKSVEEIYRDIDNSMETSFSDTTRNKITLYFGKILVEVVVVRNAEENLVYYLNSYIEDTEDTVIKGTEKTKKYLSEENKKFIIDAGAE